MTWEAGSRCIRRPPCKTKSKNFSLYLCTRASTLFSPFACYHQLCSTSIPSILPRVEQTLLQTAGALTSRIASESTRGAPASSSSTNTFTHATMVLRIRNAQLLLLTCLSIVSIVNAGGKPGYWKPAHCSSCESNSTPAQPAQCPASNPISCSNIKEPDL